MKQGKILYRGILLVSLFAFFFCVRYICKWHIENENIKRVSTEVAQESKEENKGMEELINPPNDITDSYYKYIDYPLLTIDFSKLYTINTDIKGYLKVGGTSIDFPVVQTTNNTFYLNHAIDKSINSAGSLFFDYRNYIDHLDKNTVIYGHGRLDKIMFGTLKNVLNNTWYKEEANRVIQFTTAHGKMLFQIVSVYTIPEETYYITTHFKDKEEYHQFLQKIIDRSIYKFYTTLNTKDKILTLSTCKDGKGMRLVVHAKLIKKETIS